MVPGHYANEQRINALGGYHKPQHSKRIRVCGWNLDQRPYISKLSVPLLYKSHYKLQKVLDQRPYICIVSVTLLYKSHYVNCFFRICACSARVYLFFIGGWVVGVGVCVGRWVFVSGWVGVSVYYSPCCTHQLHCGGNIRYTRALNFFLFCSIVGATCDTLGH